MSVEEREKIKTKGIATYSIEQQRTSLTLRKRVTRYRKLTEHQTIRTKKETPPDIS
jgi:hypothetical protein